MWAVYGLLALMALMLVVLSIPIGGRITYDGALTVYLRVLGITIPLHPRDGGKSDAQSKRKGSVSSPKPSKWQELKELLAQDDLEGTLHFIGDVAGLAGRAAGRLLRAVTVTDLRLQLLIAAGDPADTAQLYGAVCGFLYPALELIGQRLRRIHHRQMRVEPNFVLEHSSARFDIRLRISVWRLLGVAVTLLQGFLLLREKDKPQIDKEVS